ncbi:MAG: glycosyltransferase [Anaerolineae bacterium]|nr:glycosyltransferase [Anaerolineae bacterium]
MLLNPDTEVQPGALLALINFMDAHPEAGACGPMLLNTDGSLQPSGRRLPTAGSVFLDMTRLYRLTRRDVFVEPGRDYNQVKQVGEISGAALLIRRSLYERIGGFDTGLFLFYEDVDLCKRVGDAGFGVYYVPEAKVVHHWGGTMQKISRPPTGPGRTACATTSPHHGRPAQVFVASLVVSEGDRVYPAVDRAWPARRVLFPSQDAGQADEAGGSLGELSHADASIGFAGNY